MLKIQKSKNMQWLDIHHAEYQDEWIALRDGEFLGSDESLEKLVKRVSREHGVVFPSREVMLTTGY